jgi:hypothetical protein
VRIFLSYARERQTDAARLNSALLQEEHEVFYDQWKLLSGNSFHKPIRDALQQAELFIFLISPESVEQGRYSLTELDYYQRHRSNGPILPVQVAEVAKESIPPDLAVLVLKPHGDMVGEVIARVSEIAAAQVAKATSQWNRRLFLAVLALTLAGVGIGLCRTLLNRPNHALLLVPWTGIYDRLPSVSDPPPSSQGDLVISLRIRFGQKLYPVTDLRQQTVCLAPHGQVACSLKEVQSAWRSVVGAGPLSRKRLTTVDRKILAVLYHENPLPLEVEGMQGNETVVIEIISAKDGKETVERLDPFTMDGRSGLQTHLLIRLREGQ